MIKLTLSISEEDRDYLYEGIRKAKVFFSRGSVPYDCPIRITKIPDIAAAAAIVTEIPILKETARSNSTMIEIIFEYKGHGYKQMHPYRHSYGGVFQFNFSLNTSRRGLY